MSRTLAVWLVRGSLIWLSHPRFIAHWHPRHLRQATFLSVALIRGVSLLHPLCRGQPYTLSLHSLLCQLLNNLPRFVLGAPWVGLDSFTTRQVGAQLQLTPACCSIRRGTGFLELVSASIRLVLTTHSCRTHRYPPPPSSLRPFCMARNSEK
jgi:hypothetical protein